MLRLFDSLAHKNANLICLLGQDKNGNDVMMDLAQNPHMIVAGSTGSGKSILLHNIIGNLLNNDIGFLYLIDPKDIEFSPYSKLGRDINMASSYEGAIYILDKLIMTMEQRYKLMRNGMIFEPIVLIIDELADLMMQQDKKKEFVIKLCKLSQKCRAAKISIIVSTQRPTVGVISGAIKANFPARIACRVSSKIDSRVVMDSGGAEKLSGYGDALLSDSSRTMERFQIAYTDAEEICKKFLK